MDLISWARRKSPWICHFNTGGCNACDIEVLAALTPRFDIERFGILLRGSPRHADVLVVTGPVTRQSRERLKRIYEQVPEPKFVIAVGVCACSGGVYWGCYNVGGGIDTVIPVDVYVGGCPPRPSEIIDAVVYLIEKIRNKGLIPVEPPVIEEGIVDGE
jgi:NADH-quinone oxidoreductase B subunit